MERETPLVHITSAAVAGSSSNKIILSEELTIYIFKVLLCLHVQIHYGLSKLDFRLIKGKNKSKNDRFVQRIECTVSI